MRNKISKKMLEVLHKHPNREDLSLSFSFKFPLNNKYLEQYFKEAIPIIYKGLGLTTNAEFTKSQTIKNDNYEL